MAIRRAQAMIELAMGLFALALVVSALCAFAAYIVKSLEVQNALRVGGSSHAEVEVDAFAAANVFGRSTVSIDEKLRMPSKEILK